MISPRISGKTRKPRIYRKPEYIGNQKPNAVPRETRNIVKH